MATNREIIGFLSSKTANAGFIDKLKIKFRPIICPFDILLQEIHPNDSVFDIGCGSGQFCTLVAKFTPAKKIHGIEIKEQLVKNAYTVSEEFQQEKQITFETFNGQHIPESIADYNIIYMIDVLHHIPIENQIPFLEQVFSKMKKGSRLFLKDIDGSHPFVIFNKIHDMIFAGEIGNEMGYKTAMQQLENIGFEIKHKSTKTVYVYPHYYLIAVKN